MLSSQPGLTIVTILIVLTVLASVLVSVPSSLLFKFSRKKGVFLDYDPAPSLMQAHEQLRHQNDEMRKRLLECGRTLLERERALQDLETLLLTKDVEIRTMDAEIRSKDAEIAQLRAEVAKAAARRRPQKDAKFLAAKRRFATLYHPNSTTGSGMERMIREELFKEFWGELEEIEKGA